MISKQDEMNLNNTKKTNDERRNLNKEKSVAIFQKD